MNPMNDELQKTLQALRSEIAELGAGELEHKKRLEQLVEDIETKIDSPEHSNMVQDVKNSVAHFEVSHPKITEVLNDIMVSLSNIGI